MSEPIKVFLSYSHVDVALRSELEKHLSGLKYKNIISTWTDADLIAGTEWKKRMMEELYAAQVILLLISADFLASPFCQSAEMTEAIERHQANITRVIPIILRPVDWKDALFAHLQALPSNAQAITTWRNQDAALVDVVAGIRRAIEDLNVLSASRFPTDLRRVILAELVDGNENVRFEAAQTLAALKDPDTVPVIISRLKIEPEPITRHWLACALGLIGGELALRALQDAKATELDQFVQKGIDASLELIRNCS